jgi:hypothetical protein
MQMPGGGPEPAAFGGHWPAPHAPTAFGPGGPASFPGCPPASAGTQVPGFGHGPGGPSAAASPDRHVSSAAASLSSIGGLISSLRGPQQPTGPPPGLSHGPQGLTPMKPPPGFLLPSSSPVQVPQQPDDVPADPWSWCWVEAPDSGSTAGMCERASGSSSSSGLPRQLQPDDQPAKFVWRKGGNGSAFRRMERRLIQQGMRKRREVEVGQHSTLLERAVAEANAEDAAAAAAETQAAEANAKAMRLTANSAAEAAKHCGPSQQKWRAFAAVAEKQAAQASAEAVRLTAKSAAEAAEAFEECQGQDRQWQQTFIKEWTAIEKRQQQLRAESQEKWLLVKQQEWQDNMDQFLAEQEKERNEADAKLEAERAEMQAKLAAGRQPDHLLGGQPWHQGVPGHLLGVAGMPVAKAQAVPEPAQPPSWAIGAKPPAGTDTHLAGPERHVPVFRPFHNSGPVGQQCPPLSLGPMLVEALIQHESMMMQPEMDDDLSLIESLNTPHESVQ